MHIKNLWEDLTGVKWNSLRMKLHLSLIVCIKFHKRTFFSVDAAERLKYYFYEIDMSQFSVRYEYVLLARPAKARR